MEAEDTLDSTGAWSALRDPRPAGEAGEGVTLSGPCEVYAYKGVQGSGPQPPVRWTADGGRILFIHGTAVYEVEADGSRLERIADASGNVFIGPSRFTTIRTTYVDVSADGTRVLYAACRRHSPDGGDPEITECLYSREDTAGRDCDYPITGRREYGSRPVAVTIATDLYEIVLTDVASGQKERLFAGNAPVWSPDGERIAFISKRSESGGAVGGRNQPALYTMTAEGKDVRWVIGSADLSISHPPAWSPDGDRLAFVGDVGKFEMEPSVYTVGADGTPLKRLTETLSEPSWSPDGERIAFAKRNGNEVALYTIAADGTDARRVTAIGSWNGDNHLPKAWVRTVAWSPTGTEILYSCGERVCVVGADGTLVGSSPALFEDGVEAAWSPDGDRIVIGSAGEPGRDGIVLYTTAPEGTNRQVLVRAGVGLVAENSGYKEEKGSVEACGEGFVVADPEANAGLVRDCETLIEIRDALFGGAAVNWSAGVPIEEWFGIALSGTPRRVTGLTLDGAHPEYIVTAPATIPAELARLDNLDVLRLSGVGLRGPIPPEMGNLSDLRVLDLSGNWLDEPIPPEIGNLANLRVLNLNHSTVHGEVPAELGQLASLEVLDLGSNSRMMGTIPAELGNLSKLRYLDLSADDLRGPIPVEFGRLTNLVELRLSANYLSGEMPKELGGLSNLTVLDLERNRLTGAIPRELGQLDNLRELGLRENKLTGEIPAELGRLTKLERLTLDRNRLTGEIPAELGRLTKLKELRLTSNLSEQGFIANRFTGCIPGGLRDVELSDLRQLELPHCDRQVDAPAASVQEPAAAVGLSGWWALLALPLLAIAVPVVVLVVRRRLRS